jgi:hypothetical protein
MGILSNLGKWIFENIPAVINIVKESAELAHKSASVVDALLEGKTIFSGGEAQQVSSVKNKKLPSIEEAHELEQRRIQLRMDVMELAVSSFTFERFSNNINLHAANLQIHLQTIQNTEGLLGDVNRQRVAVKALMGTVNHLVNVLGLGSKVNKIEGLDIDIRLGSISILGACEAFGNTRNLLLHEIDAFSDAIQGQLVRVENIRSAARDIPDLSQHINLWLESSVEPKLMDTKNHAKKLKDDLLIVTHLDDGLRRGLKTIKQDDL